VQAVFNDPDGLNINENCGATDVKALAKLVISNQADIGIALDGDADRLIMIDHNGVVVDGDELLYIIAKGAQSQGKLNGGVVGTLMSNLGLEKALIADGIDFVRAKVGDRYVMELLNKNDWNFGGESSGHLICLDKNSTGDGIIAALQVLSVLVNEKKTLSELKSGMTKYPQTMINVKVSQQQDPMQNAIVAKAVSQVEHELADTGRVLLRASGTEPLIRVMIEGEDPSLVQKLTEQLAAVVESNL